MALLEFKSWPGLDEGIFESYVHLNIVVPVLLQPKSHVHVLSIELYRSDLFLFRRFKSFPFLGQWFIDVI